MKCGMKKACRLMLLIIFLENFLDEIFIYLSFIMIYTVYNHLMLLLHDKIK